MGENEFVKVEYTYPLEFAKIALQVKAKQFGLLTGGMSDPNSAFLLFRTKGRVEAAIQDIFKSGLTIYRPALLTNRRNDERLGEKILSYVPFIPKIDSKDLGAAIVERTVDRLINSEVSNEILENQEIKDMLNNYRKK